jgi:hypothetical protein
MGKLLKLRKEQCKEQERVHWSMSTSFVGQRRYDPEQIHHQWFWGDWVINQKLFCESDYTHYFSTHGCKAGSTVCFWVAGLLTPTLGWKKDMGVDRDRKCHK